MRIMRWQVVLACVVFGVGLALGVAGEPWLRATAGFILRTIVPPPVEPLPAVDDGGDMAEAPLFAMSASKAFVPDA
jgi:hypothetical protein